MTEKKEKKILLASPHMSGYEMDYIQEAFDTNWIAPLGPNVTGFEQEVCAYTGANYAEALSSGTAAIHMALMYLGVGKGDIVFCPSLTFSASANPIIYLGATPVFIDSERESWNMSPAALAKAFEKYPHPKAVVVVNLYGQSADFDELKAIADEHQVPIVEDAAESLGATYKGVMTGTIGEIGIYSFNGNKIITTSGGGMLVAREKKIIEKVEFWATQAKENAPYYQHKEIGYNYRMSNVVAGIGRGQLRVLDERIAKKKYIFDYYADAFQDIEELEMMPIAAYGEPNYWLSCITIRPEAEVRPKALLDYLASKNIEGRQIWKPMHLQPVFKGVDFFSHNPEGTSVSEDIFARGLCLPSDTKMTDEDLERVVTRVSWFFGAEAARKSAWVLTLTHKGIPF
ncbi:DegT/DnrJ/EryC1/StrS family aminotransferase [Trichococcus ilyis]|jgi:dTDP-4-amino-4,6-dideoxygalactose transaminase|uniref:Degt/dnrj/eryc1/strs aminotransferase n=1 Tax=Trichococcus ilyis TaxID=640938 RepID=A0A143YPE9_9LACT|nr:DegT/DnrJ/EryC1/StrS family aminotransferase [Trichococcus ilyis]CZQ94133.1 degt/dnrj/eryc1/strs aminotransferase [Trichococcus ilyis]SEJ00634.1 dTDP-4-amino-4,6-dideoxygalactose transaminase [Trichococcus ilyis]